MADIKNMEIAVEKIAHSNQIGYWMIKFMRQLGVTRCVRKILIYCQYDKDRKKPTREMKETTNFFEKNKDKVEQILLLLEDKVSKDTYAKVIEYRCTHNRKNAPLFDMRNQYFPKDIISLSDDEVLIDCGAYVGDTALNFKKTCSNKFKRIVCFEPDTYNYSCLIANIKKDERIVAIQAGIWSEEGHLGFSNGSGAAAKIAQEYNDVGGVDVRTIDRVEECQDATFIKMDIEGAEYNAILGAQNVIKKNHPKLAICIYHSDEDMIRIIELIRKIDCSYRFYVRHHHYGIWETVLYAI